VSVRHVAGRGDQPLNRSHHASTTSHMERSTKSQHPKAPPPVRTANSTHPKMLSDKDADEE
ncbi:hypothetical protein, partial [uncultured Lacticaseibacillus sp.]|uniref:hypothetical protein n=1 Tax=uncultured Lacticaseibacillus sp. TaxID=2775882 RepID=UPI0025944012